MRWLIPKNLLSNKSDWQFQKSFPLCAFNCTQLYVIGTHLIRNHRKNRYLNYFHPVRSNHLCVWFHIGTENHWDYCQGKLHFVKKVNFLKLEHKSFNWSIKLIWTFFLGQSFYIRKKCKGRENNISLGGGAAPPFSFNHCTT